MLRVWAVYDRVIPNRVPLVELMKTERVLVVILGIAVVVLAVLYMSLKRESLAELSRDKGLTNTVELWRTNTVEAWRTNTVVKWRTNTVELWHTNTVLQHVTNSVVREAPGKIPDALRRAALLGYKYDNAPTITVPSDALYKATPLSLRIGTNMGKQDSLSDEDVETLEIRSERTLRAHGIPTVGSSPHGLRIDITSVWATDVPAVMYCTIELELEEEVLLTRQSDAVKCEGVVWRSTSLAIVPKVNVAEELSKHVQARLKHFCKEAEKAKSRESQIESALPRIPASFVGQSE